MIHYLHHNEIDKIKWDACIESSVNKLVYAYSWYLDVVSPGWEALVMDDYEVLMPLTCKKKWSINYLIQPVFAQQLGVFSNGVKDKDMMELFFQSIPKKFKYIAININSFNQINELLISSIRIDQHLFLQPTYEELFKNYSESTKKNIRRAQRNKVVAYDSQDYDKFNQFKSLDTLHPVSTVVIDILKKLSVQLSDRKRLKIIICEDAENGEFLSAGYFIVAFKKIIYLASTSTLEGRRRKSKFIITDELIKSFAGTGFVFDFAGSNIEGVNYFNNGFGAQNTVYSYVEINRLPWPIKYLKR